MIFKFGCPSCGQRLEATTEMTGERVTCPSCAHQLEIPASGSLGSMPVPMVRLRPPPSWDGAKQADRAPSRPPPAVADDGPVVQLRPLAPPPVEPAPVAAPPSTDQVVPVLLPAQREGARPIIVVPPARPKRVPSVRLIPPAATVPGSKELDQELAHLEQVCDPTPWERQPLPNQPAGGDLLDELPEAIPVDEAQHEPTENPRPLPELPSLPGSSAGRKAKVYALMAVALLVLGAFVVVVASRPLQAWQKRLAAESEEGPEAQADPGPGVAPGVAGGGGEMPTDSELDAYRFLDTQALVPPPLSAEHAAAVAGYLADFPDGLHRTEVLVYAMAQAHRAILPDSGAEETVRVAYRQLGQQALAEMLARAPAERDGLLDMRQLVLALCQDKPDPKDLRLAEAICREYPEDTVENAWLCAAVLDAQPEGADQAFFLAALYDAVAGTPVESWHHAWLDRFAPEALRLARTGQRPGKQLLGVCRSLHFVGRTEEALPILSVLTEPGHTDAVREAAQGWRMCWDPAYAASERQQALVEAERQYRASLPQALAQIDRRALARSCGLPWPLPEPPQRTIEDLRKEADTTAAAEALEQFPDSRFAEIRQEAEERFRPYVVGQEVRLLMDPERTFRRVVSGPYRSRTQSHVRIGDRDIMLEDMARDDRVRFDPVWCQEEKDAYVQRETRNTYTRRAALERRVAAELLAKGLTAAGYVRRGDVWVNPHVVFEQAVGAAAESVSQGLRLQTAADQLRKAGFEAKGGSWVPVPPAEEEEE